MLKHLVYALLLFLGAVEATEVDFKQEYPHLKKRIYQESLGRSKEEVCAYFGDWILCPELLQESFQNAEPYPYVVIDNFFAEDIYEKLVAEFPSQEKGRWHRYYNPIENKHAFDDLDQMPQIYRELFIVLNEGAFLKVIESLTGISALEADPFLHGAGLHSHGRGGKLDIHLDYSKHPVTGKERRLNLIAFCTSDWKEEWGGNLELWDENMSACKGGSYPFPNRAVLFRTSDISYHGLPNPITCPEGEFRRSMAVYYMTDLRKDSERRLKASYFKRPQDRPDLRMDKLREIRAKRRITEKDLEEIWPDWENSL